MESLFAHWWGYLRHYYCSANHLGNVLQYRCPFEEPVLRGSAPAPRKSADVQKWDYCILVRDAGDHNAGCCTCAPVYVSVSRSAAVHRFLGGVRNAGVARPDFAPIDDGAPVRW